jgi:hypothetical protein
MTFFIMLALADGIGHIGQTKIYQCDKCEKKEGKINDA